MKPLLIYDGACGFCRSWIGRWRALTGDRVDDAPYQDVADRFPEISIEEFRRAVQFIDADGRVYSAAEAVFRSLAVRPSWAWPLWLYLHVPGFKSVSEGLYRFVAANRSGLSRRRVGPRRARSGDPSQRSIRSPSRATRNPAE